MQLRSHTITLCGEHVVLRPMTEDDWETLLAWNNDPEVLYFAEGDDVQSRSLAEVQAIYRHVSQNAFCFIVELGGRPIGECWLQQMNLERILQQHPGQDCRRIDLLIGEQDYWGLGLGSEVIRLLTNFAFTQAQADIVFGCDIADYNPASRRAFEKAGYRVTGVHEQPPGQKARRCYDVSITREQYQQRIENQTDVGLRIKRTWRRYRD